MAKIRRSTSEHAGHHRLNFFCPACQTVHSLNTTWTFNGDYDKPTISPSIKVTGGESGIVCHSFIRDGRIEFCSDSTHALAGQTVDLPDFGENVT